MVKKTLATPAKRSWGFSEKENRHSITQKAWHHDDPQQLAARWDAVSAPTQVKVTFPLKTSTSQAR